jgi:hypothetical protein
MAPEEILMFIEKIYPQTSAQSSREKQAHRQAASRRTVKPGETSTPSSRKQAHSQAGTNKHTVKPQAGAQSSRKQASRQAETYQTHFDKVPPI